MENGPRYLGKINSLLEVFSVLVLGNLLAAIAMRQLDIPSIDQIRGKSLGTPPDYVGASGAMLKFLGVQYVCLLAIPLLSAILRRSSRPKTYGFTLNGKSFFTLTKQGVTAVSLVGIPLLILQITLKSLNLPPLSPYLSKPFVSEFWLFMAIGSFLIIPILEEVFYRGYCQTRLGENFGGGGAIFIVGLSMVLAHTQYLHLTWLSAALLCILIPMSIAMGFLYWRTGSLIPGIILHGAMNFPIKGIFQYIVLGGLILIAVYTRRTWIEWITEFKCSIVREKCKWSWAIAIIVLIAGVIGLEKNFKPMFIAAGITLAFSLFVSVKWGSHRRPG